MARVLVFDVGGTQLRGALFDTTTSALASVTRVPTSSILSAEHALDPASSLFLAIEDLGKRVQSGCDVSAVCLGFPGPIDESGYALTAPTIWGSHRTGSVDLQSPLQRIWPNTPVFILNDVTAAGYSHLRSPHDDLCIVTVSSGIGNKIFLGGLPQVGPHGRGGEIGHLRVDFSRSAPVCDCGSLGHLGAVASGRATVFQARRLFDENPAAFLSSSLGQRLDRDISRVGNLSIVECYREKDEWTAELIRRMSVPLGRVLAGIHLSLGLERFVIMGGFALALGEKYLSLVAEAASDASWSFAVDWCHALELGTEADGLLGCGLHAALQLALHRSPAGTI